MRIPVYVYSNRNITGSVLALIALGAYFSGVIHELWYVIAAGGYGIGALVARDGGTLETRINDEMSVKDAVEAVGRLAAEAQKRFPPEIAQLVAQIAGDVATVLPRLAAHGVADAAFTDVRFTATT
ncbi:MAG: hypothetical protein NVS4B13_10850 [Candidatus Elarobacter sp.]